MTGKLRCFLGLHDWVHRAEKAKFSYGEYTGLDAVHWRECMCCPKVEFVSRHVHIDENAKLERWMLTFNPFPSILKLEEK